MPLLDTSYYFMDLQVSETRVYGNGSSKTASKRDAQQQPCVITQSEGVLNT